MNMKVKVVASSFILLLLSACATGPVKPNYVSPTVYQNLNCNQLQGEYNRLQQYISQGVETPKRTFSGLGLGLGGGWGRGGFGFGPSVSFNVGQSSNTKRTELSQLLGQQDAIAQAARFKNCYIQTVKRN